MTSGHVWKKAPKGWGCTRYDDAREALCGETAILKCVTGHYCHEARCSRHKPRKRRGGK